MRPGGGAAGRLHGAGRRSAAHAVRPSRAGPGGAGGGPATGGGGGIGSALPAPQHGELPAPLRDRRRHRVSAGSWGGIGAAGPRVGSLRGALCRGEARRGVLFPLRVWFFFVPSRARVVCPGPLYPLRAPLLLGRPLLPPAGCPLHPHFPPSHRPPLLPPPPALPPLWQPQQGRPCHPGDAPSPCARFPSWVQFPLTFPDFKLS